MNKKFWVLGYLALVMAALITVSALSVSIDPFFHFHSPDTDRYYYTLDNQRSQNNGIVKNFEYEGIITGTSMTENFKTSVAEDLFGVKFINNGLGRKCSVYFANARNNQLVAAF